jgi:steroid delta-isomerase-like uncharacterized protein
MAMHDVEVESFAYSDVTIRSYGDVAVMQSRWRQNARLRGKDWSGEGLLTDVWVRRDGRWQVVARHSSLVSNSAGAAAADGNAHCIRRLFEEVFNAGHIAATDDLTTADVLGHDATNPEPRRGHEAVKQVALLFRSAFPDLRLTLDDLVAAGDRVVARWTLAGTHRGAFMGAAPTGKRATTGGIVIYRLEGGRIAEYWGSFDALGLLRQLGALPLPADAPSTGQ